jgi:hypothetical protein
MLAFYLTHAKYALDDLHKCHLKISRLEDLNDPFELMAVALPEPAHRIALEATKRQIGETRGVICFSQSWRNPVLWAHYADKHRGIALGFEIDESKIQTISYASQRLRMKLEDESGNPALTPEMMNAILTTKYRDWKYEKEVRVVCALEDIDPETGLYFAAFDASLRLRQVILGPRCTVTHEQIAEAVHHPNSQVQVISSRLAFNSFRVVRNKAIPITKCPKAT